MSETSIDKDSIMRLGSLFIMIVAIATIIIAPALVGAGVGALASLALPDTNITSAALIGALSGACSGLAFLLNAGMNGGGKGL